jgi:hypothetical protein|tara:strand:- start:7067 stop:7282 length:216 start_codon:yes stop_codon:yes gene_type:complete
MTVLKAIARVIGNSGMFFVTPYLGSTIAGLPSLEIALYTTLIGLILSTSRELIEYGKGLKTIYCDKCGRPL